MKPTLRELWDRGGVTAGGWCAIPSAFSAELMGRAGFDWVCIDTQHGLIGYDVMVPMLQALTATGCPSIVRVAWNDAATIMKTLDAGAEGVIVPMVNTVADAKAAVAACRYAPVGGRSWGPMRARMVNPEYSVDSGAEVICTVMIETVEALSNLDAILAVDGIDAIFVGPNDLAVSMGVRGSSYAGEDQRHRDAMERIGSACAERGITAGIMCGSPEVADQWRRKGFKMLAVGNDAALLAGSAAAAAKRGRELAADGTGPAR
jgi:4-hydroxy-2-oxoheptanedioate aldolase